ARFMVIRHAGHELQELHEPLIKCLDAHDVKGCAREIVRELTETRHSIMERVMDEEAAFWHLGASGE
ncbi:MAG: hypothetical protein HQK66_07250, partial [Desulfamplus sp.]|nr:hypothetical protein [Desulfamplus sp.]